MEKAEDRLPFFFRPSLFGALTLLILSFFAMMSNGQTSGALQNTTMQVLAAGKTNKQIAIPTQAPTPTPTPSPTPTVEPTADPIQDSVWDMLAQCETNGNWAEDTGNGYYGGLQFAQSSWESVGGSGNPAEASREEQIMRGKLLQARSGWAAWGGCAEKLELD